jgi:hypothetical protein
MPELNEKESFWNHFIGNVKAKKKAAAKAPRPAKTATVKPPKPEAPKPQVEPIHVPETPKQKQDKIFKSWEKEPLLKKHYFKNP